MKRITREALRRKEILQAVRGQEWLIQELAAVRAEGKTALDECVMKMGRILAESLLYAEREQMAGPEYQPAGAYRKWGTQLGSVYLGDRKVRITHPRLRDDRTEVILPCYRRMRQPGEFSEELLSRSLRGLSGRKYRETVVSAADAFGISPSAVSHRLIQATTKKLKALKERDLSGLALFALVLDTVHRGGAAFVVGLGVDLDGKKHVLGFWEGATENKEIAQALLSDLESRGLKIPREILFITDGGKGLIAALKDRMGPDLIHQRCTIHKDRNLQRHLPKRWRDEAHRRFRNALGMRRYEDAKAELEKLEVWLSERNESAAASLREGWEELLTLHRLEVPPALQVSLHSTNMIESLFSTVRHCEKNLKRYRNSRMAQRWLAAVALYAEEQFRTVKGFQFIPEVVERIKRLQAGRQVLKQAA
jgi:transposase-like protein